LLLLGGISIHTNAAEIPEELKNARITEKLGEKIDLDGITVISEEGKPVPLRTYFKGDKPVLLSMIYYTCPSLCNFMLNGLTETLKEFEWLPGKQFEHVTVSIHPDESREVAAKKKENYLKLLGKPEAAAGWHFLTAAGDQSRKLADQVGFGYVWDEKSQQYAHQAAIFILTPDGRISRYLYGVRFGKQDLKLSLLEASNGKIGNVIDQVILFCYRYDPASRGYALVAMKLMQLGCALMTLIVGLWLFFFWRRQAKNRSKAQSNA
jgi:protein SCO1/2